MCAFAAFGGIFLGFDSGYINGVMVMAMKFFIHTFTGLPYPPADSTPAELATFNVPAGRQSLIVSFLSEGTFFGALIAGDMANFISHRMTIIAGSSIFTLGVILQTAVTAPIPSSKRNQGIFFENGLTRHLCRGHRASNIELNVEELPSSTRQHEEVELAKAKLKAAAGSRRPPDSRYPDSDVDRSWQQ
jgi:hypothetical protein